MTTIANVYLLLTGVSLPLCCRPQVHSSSVKSTSSSQPSRLLHAQVVHINSLVGLSYVAWKCKSLSDSPAASSAPPRPNKVHTQWIPQRHICIVHPSSPDANAALGRGPHDSKFEGDNPHVALWSSTSGSMGRFTVAKHYIHVGEQVFQAAGFAVIVRQSLVPRRCHWCFTVLRRKALQCADCEFARYCSRDCLDTDAALHGFQCQALCALKHRSYNVGDVEMVRLALAVLSMEHFVKNTQALKLLVVNRQQENEEEKETRAAVEFIVNMANQVLDPQHVRVTLERVRCNAHPLYLDGVSCVGTGVFPEAAMALNHSCMPNVAPSFDPRTRTLAFHAIVKIPQGCAVEYSYIDLLQTRKRRQSLLLKGFSFECTCNRCTTEARETKDPVEDDEEDEARVMEQLMQVVNSNQSDVKQRVARLKKEHESVFRHSSEARFALYTTEMQLARAQSDWTCVIKAAEMLLEIWTRCGLPGCYHTTETLHLQICLAAEQAGMHEKAKQAAQKVSNIRQICGYSHPETRIG